MLTKPFIFSFFTGYLDQAAKKNGSRDPTLGLCPGAYGGPSEAALSYERGIPIARPRLQRYLADEKSPPFRTRQQAYAQGLMVVLGCGWFGISEVL